jgi:hypothetical protein
MVLRFFGLLFLFCACKATDSQIVNNQNCEVYFTKVLGNKKNKKPFVMFEVIFKESFPKEIEFISLTFNEEDLELSQIKNNQMVAYWYESEPKLINKQDFNTVFVNFREGLKVKKLKLSLKPQKPLFEPMAPNSRKNE